MKKIFIFLITLSLAFNIYAKSKTDTKLSYQSFVDYAESGKIKSLKITNFGVNPIKAVIVKDGKEIKYVVDKPYKIGEDIVFIEFLKKNKIPYEITEKNYNPGSMFWLSSFSGIIIFLSPLLTMIFVIIIMIRTKKMEKLLKNMQSNKIESKDPTDSNL